MRSTTAMITPGSMKLLAAWPAEPYLVADLLADVGIQGQKLPDGDFSASTVWLLWYSSLPSRELGECHDL